MKTQHLFISLFVIVFHATSFSSVAQTQPDSILIDPALSSNVVIDIRDTTLYNPLAGTPGPGTRQYALDIEGNGINDFLFKCYHYLGGLGTMKHIKLQAGDGSMFIYDTVSTVVGHNEAGSDDPFYSTTRSAIVKMHELNDTLYVSDNYAENEIYLSNQSTGNYPSYIEYDNLDNWNNMGPHYIGIRKEIGSETYLGWIKILIEDYFRLTVMEYALNYPGLTASNRDHNQGNMFALFPNPAKDKLWINHKKSTAVHVKIYSMTGYTKLDKMIAQDEQAIDISLLAKGSYIIQLSSDEASERKLFIKE